MNKNGLPTAVVGIDVQHRDRVIDMVYTVVD